MTPTPSRLRPQQSGFTLVELMVALALSMILAIAILNMQLKLGQQRMRTSDIAVRDGETRAAMDLMTQDASGTGFLLGNMTAPCSALLTYDDATTGKYFVHHEIDAVPAASGATLPFSTTLSLNYPPVGTASDVLVITGSTDASNFNDAVAPMIHGTANIAYTPTSTGDLPLDPSHVPTTGHVAIVQTTDTNTSGFPPVSKMFCMRVPLTSTPGSNAWHSGGTLMPPTFYAGFGTQMAAAGFAGPMSDAVLYNANLVDIGDPTVVTPTPTQTTTVFYVANVAGIAAAGNVPVLMRAQYSLLNDAQVLAPQQIAAGVVSLQVRFNVGKGVYKDAATVTSTKVWDNVCSVRVAVVTRSLYDDPDSSYVWTPTPLTPGTATAVKPASAQTWATGSVPFTDVPVATAFQHRRFLLQQTDLPMRNWQLAKGVTC